MDDTKNYYLINIIVAALVWLCCYLNYFESYIAMFVLWLPLFLLDVVHNKCLGKFWIDTNILVYVSAYLLMLALGVLLAPHKGDGSGVIRHCFWIYPMLMLGYLRNKASINKGILYGLELTIITGSVCSLVDLFYWKIDRPSGLMYNPILWASFLSFMLPVFFYGWKKAKQGSQKWFRFFVCILIVVNLFLTKTRGVIVAVVIVGVLLLIWHGIKHQKKITLVGFVVGMVGLYFFYTNYFGTFQRSYDGDRLAAWYASILMFMDHPLFGVGFMQWKENFATVYAQPNVIELLPHAHNMYLGAIASTGIVGLTGLLIFLGGWIRISWQQLQQGKSYYYYTLIGIAFFTTHGLFDYVLKAGLYEKVIWLVVFIYQYDFFEEKSNN